jgi:16S rRNA (guanine527-N7)-methyltransferase
MIAGGRQRRDGVRPVHLRTPPPRLEELAQDRARALALTPVSRETADRLDRFVALLLEWQRRINLIAASTEPIVWTRHVADSLQLLALAPSARLWADLGSGGGFPGIVIACALAGTPGARVDLIESNTKKAAFLREAVRVTGAPAVVHCTRAADFVAKATEPIEVVTARAFAPLSGLLAAAYPLLKTGAAGLFPKGQGIAAELTEAAKCWKIQATLALSRTDPKARIVVVRGLEPISGAPAETDLFEPR